MHALISTTVLLSLLVVASLVTGAVVGHGNFAPPSQLTVVTDINYPPYLFQSEGGELQGILKEKWALWSRTTGVAVRVIGMDWAQAQQSVQEGKYDVIEALGYTARRAGQYEFSRPYSPIEARVYFHRTISAISNDVASLRGFTIGAKAGSACGNWLAESDLEVARSYPTSEALVLAAGAGEIRLFCMDAPAAQYFLYKHRLADQFRQTSPLYATAFHWAVRKGRGELRDFIQRGFDSIPAKEIEMIEAGWLGNPLRFPIATRYLYYLAAAALALLGAGTLLLLWNRALRRRVATGTTDLTAALTGLQSAEQERERLNAILTRVTEAVPLCLSYIDEDDRYAWTNTRNGERLGRTPESIVGRTAREVYGKRFGEIGDGGVLVRRGERVHEERAWRSPGGNLRTYEHILIPELGSNGDYRGHTSMWLDISERKATEEARRRSAERLRATLDNTPGVAVQWFDRSGRVIYWNTASEKLYGIAGAKAVGKTMDELLHTPEQYREFLDLIAAMERSGEPCGPLEIAIRGRNGGEVTVLYTMFMVPGEGADPIFVCMDVDISERKRAERHVQEYAERLQALSRRLIEAQEAERRALARELHDEVGQQLTAVLFTLHALKDRTTDPDFAAKLEEGKDFVNRVIDEIRNTSIRLRPTVLDDLGLVPALRWLVEQQRAATGADIGLELSTLSSDVPPEIATGCFRIVQESITNAMRHARAGRVRVRLAECARRLNVEVEDNGLGFDPEQARAKAAAGRSSGLTGMRERAALLGGTLEIHAAPGRGTVIHASLPLEQSPAVRSADQAADSVRRTEAFTS